MDFNLYQALREAPRVVARQDGEVWRQLARELDETFGELGIAVDDVGFDKQADRFDRNRLHKDPYKAMQKPRELDTELNDRVIGSLHAVYDEPSEDKARRAIDALRDLRQSLRPRGGLLRRLLPG